ncbi:MAG: ATP phosphoribosyltransferase regulatory subunit [Gammaproteobacteria bacterium]|jgi:ATP phosphoribosyltransferase regulatory subunit
MKPNNNWLLPDDIDELLPPEAQQVEMIKRKLLDLYDLWGYEFVNPPIIEYLDSLLTGTGSDLDTQTFKLTDQLSGRMMGIRADTTPQVARIDAHKLKRETPTRLCYMGTVLRTRADSLDSSRNPFQVGAELFGHDGVASDVEILQLMLETISTAGVRSQHLDLGHVGIYRGLVAQAGLDRAQEMAFFDALQRKAATDLQELIARFDLDGPVAAMFESLVSLNGDESVIATARQALAAASDEVHAAIDYLERVAQELKSRMPDASIHYDLAELRAYHYQTGVVFAAFAPGSGTEIARGGRYNDIGKAFGRARPATGFSAYLKTLVRMAASDAAAPHERDAILAPWGDDAALLTLVGKLRAEGKRVIQELPGQTGGAADMQCNAVIRRRDNGWVVESSS